jgi:Uma2 family endonuclease
VSVKRGGLVSIEKYLHTAYHPDREYVDGQVFERNWGDRDHSSTQGELIFFFAERARAWRCHVYPGLRIRMSPTRVRVPDISVYVGEEPREQIPSTPPFICIEILSPEDRFARTQQKIDDYLKFGVPYVFVIHPRERRAWSYSKDGSTEIRDGALRTENLALVVPLAEIFGELEAG